MTIKCFISTYHSDKEAATYLAKATQLPGNGLLAGMDVFVTYGKIAERENIVIAEDIIFGSVRDMIRGGDVVVATVNNFSHQIPNGALGLVSDDCKTIDFGALGEVPFAKIPVSSAWNMTYYTAQLNNFRNVYALASEKLTPDFFRILPLISSNKIHICGTAASLKALGATKERMKEIEQAFWDVGVDDATVMFFDHRR